MDLPANPAKNFQRSLLVALFLLMLTSSAISHAQVNKCNINGKIVYTDQTCPDNGAQQLILNKQNVYSSKAVVKDSASSNKTKYNSATWLRDSQGYTQALKISAEKNVPIFIYAYTDWCGYCKKLHKTILDDWKVKKALSGFVKVKINPEHSAADEKLFHQWGGTGYPTLYIQSDSDSAPDRTRGPFTKKNGQWKLMKKEAFIAMLGSNRQ